MLLIDKYAYTNRLSNTNPKIKMGIALIFLIVSMITHNILILLSIIFLMSTAIVFIAKVDFKIYLLRRPIYFLIIGVITNIINISFESDSMVHSFKVLNIYIGVSSKSLESSKYILIRSISCLTCIYFFVLTTPFNQVLYLLKKLNISDAVVEISMLIYRFIFIFLEELIDIKKSQELRFGYINLKTSYKSIGILGSLLFKRLIKKYEDMSISLDMKLYDGKFHIVGDRDV